MNKIYYCQCTYGERMEQTKKCVTQVRPWVDECIIIHDDVDDESLKWLESMNCRTIHKKWIDYFSKYRNYYVNEVPVGDWILVSDPDELFNDDAVRSFRKLIEDAENIGCNQVEFDNQYEMLRADGTKYVAEPCGNYKILLFKREPNTRYTGLVHETLHGGICVLRAPKNCFFYHLKEEWEVEERGARNYFCCGSGINVQGSLWREFRQWMYEKYGIERWKDLRATIRKRKDMPKGILKFILNLPNIMDGNESPVHREVIAFFKWLKLISSDEDKEFYRNFMKENDIPVNPISQEDVM
nr:MAG: glycosyltransferase [Helarchaeota virus Nidhogg Meg22_1012]